MPGPRSMISIGDVAAAFEQAQLDRRPGRAGVDRVLDEMGERLFEPDRVGERGERRLAGDPDRMRPPLLRGQRVEQRAHLDRARRLGLARGAGREAGEQVVHLLHRALQGRDHVGAELGIVGVALGVAGDEAELAHQILDVVHDEGEAPVELVEALRVGERVLALGLGDIGGGLDAGGAEQVEILPVERRGGSPDARG